MLHARTGALLLALAGAVSSCASLRGSPRERLPFHVAILPVTIHPHPADPTVGDGEAATLALDPEVVRASLAEVLGRECFVEVSATHPSGDDGAPEAHVQDAFERGADLVLSCSVDHDSTLRAERNEKFWLNLPLFLLGGPACYFIDDHSYLGSARLRASLQDVHPLVQGRASLADGRSEYAYVEGRLSGLSLDFIDRASGVGSYALSLVVPSGLLASRGERVDAALARRAADELAEALAHEILGSVDTLRGSARVCPYFLADGVELTSDGTATWIRGEVLARRDSPVRPTTCLARLGETTVSVRLPREGTSLPGDRYEEFPLELRLQGRGSVVRLEIEADGRDPMVRSYTLKLP